MRILKLNPLATILCLIMVITVGYLIVSMTRDSGRRLVRAPVNQQAFDAREEPPPSTRDGQATVRLPGIQYEPATTPAMPGGPDVAVTAAPGVAFNYRYALRLPAEHIARVQEQHAAACERLGVDRCRITGLRYRVVNEQDIEAMLAVSLAPDLARRFGRAGIEAAARADGKLVDAEISGVDADQSIRDAGRELARLRDELRRAERRLALQLTAEERLRLDDQAEQLRRMISAAESGRDEDRESLASTPLVFQYGAGELAPVDSRPSIGGAAKTSLANFLEGISILLIIGVTLLPWLLLALLAWWLIRLALRRSGTQSQNPLPIPTAG